MEREKGERVGEGGLRAGRTVVGEGGRQTVAS
jgi:hypothetical protein